MSKTKLMLGDNILSLKKLPENSVDSIVTDPPYGLSFMGKKWDYDVPSVEFWKEVYRVLKPGGHILSFGGTRTYHRMVVNIEDAGFEIRDQVMWLYGSGFPKSHNIGKAVDKIEGNEREVVSSQESLWKPSNNTYQGDSRDKENLEKWSKKSFDYTKGQSKYEGWGTALKPANEPICVARKPLSEKTIAENVIKWGTGGINIDGCRIEGAYGSGQNEVIEGKEPGAFTNYDQRKEGSTATSATGYKHKVMVSNSEGRFPANIILDESAAELLDRQSGVSESKKRKNPSTRKDTSTLFNGIGITNTGEGEYNDKGGASRFFYVAKVSKKERNLGLDGFEEKEVQANKVTRNPDKEIVSKNTHPTLKPINLMTYLCRLVTPEGGIVLDPFMGSGSTGIAARLEGFKFIGMEMDGDYFKIAEARINSYEEYRKLLK